MRFRAQEHDLYSRHPVQDAVAERDFAAPSRVDGHALERALAEDRRQRDAQTARHIRRMRAAWRVYCALGWFIPLVLACGGAVLAMQPVVELFGVTVWGIEDLWWTAAFGVALGLVGAAFWFCVGDWVGRKLLCAFLAGMRREGIGFDVSESGTSRTI